MNKVNKKFDEVDEFPLLKYKMQNLLKNWKLHLVILELL